MDFTTVKSLTIPEGEVTQITDASGRVIWSANKKVMILTMFTNTPPTSWVEFNGEIISNANHDGSGSRDIKIGTIIKCCVKNATDSYIKINDVKVTDTYIDPTNQALCYDYVMKQNTGSITLSSSLTGGMFGTIVITES